jgi:hypothetical protein
VFQSDKWSFAPQPEKEEKKQDPKNGKKSDKNPFLQAVIACALKVNE